MPDAKFHHRSGRFTLGELAKIAGATLSDTADPDRVIEDIASLDKADSVSLSFLDNKNYKDRLLSTKAGACIISPAMQDYAPKALPLLLTPTPYKGYALVAQAFYPEEIPPSSISDHAFIDSTAKLGVGCVVEHGAVIGAGAEIGEGCWIEQNVVLGQNIKIGKKGRIGANSTVTHSLIGNNLRIYPGCSIGQDGFGFAICPEGPVKVPQLGRVIIGDNVEIGANTTIDRGAGPDTEIGAGTRIDNLVQIAHNVKIGKGCVIVAQVGISGSTIIEDYVMLAGQAGITGHLRIGTGARIGAQAGVMRDVPAGEEQLGSPAMPLRQAMRQLAMLKRLVKKKK